MSAKEPCLWALTYECDGKLWSVNHYGTHESAHRNSINLNTLEPEKVHLLVPEQDYRRSMN